MSTIALRDLSIHTYGELPNIGDTAPNVTLTRSDLTSVSFDDFLGKAMLLNVYPSIDTNVCFQSVKKFSEFAQTNDQISIACISMDLPFALKRVQEGESLDNILLLSDYRNREFGELYGLTIADGPVAGLLARAIILMDKSHKVIYRELVSDVSQPPNYDNAMAALQQVINQI